MYVIGYFITHYTIEEVKKKQETFRKLIKYSLIALSFLTLYEAAQLTDYFFTSVFFLITGSILYLLPEKKVISYKKFLTPILMGVVLGVLFQNNFIVLIACSYYFFKSNYDYLKKNYLFNSWKSFTLLLIFYFSVIFLSNYFSINVYSAVLIIVSCTVLLRLLRL